MKSFRQFGGYLGMLLALGLVVTPSLAHGPLDNSATITIGPDQIEASVTLGTDAARKFFAEHLPGTPLPQPVGRGASLPVTAVEKMFVLTMPDGTLVPREFRVLTDGLEYLFVATFPGAQATSLGFRAKYFTLAEQMPPGTLHFHTEDRRLGAEVLSRDKPSVEVTIQPAVGKAGPTPAISRETSSANEPIILTNQSTAITSQTSRAGRFACLAVIGLIAATVVGFLLGQRRGG